MKKGRIFFFLKKKRNKKDFFDAGSENAVAGLPLSPHDKSLFASFFGSQKKTLTFTQLPPYETTASVFAIRTAR